LSVTKPIIPIQSACVKTTCPYCGVGCGVEASPKSATEVTIAGDEAHPSNFGRLCVKGSALGDTIECFRVEHITRTL